MMKFIKSFYINSRFFYCLLGVGAVFFVSFLIDALFNIGVVIFSILLIAFLVDVILLFFLQGKVDINRLVPDRLSNGDQNEIKITAASMYPFRIDVRIVDEIPFQFQIRDFDHRATIEPNTSYGFLYHLRPTTRGEYSFGKLNAYVSSPIGLVSRRFIAGQAVVLATYPSFIQLRKYHMIAFSNQLNEYGLKRIRRIGHTMEFEQIKEYISGDDIRTINWKATSKRKQLMVNQYQDEKSQPVYQLIDCGRSMYMPFQEMTLLDHAINATLAVSDIVLKKNDKAGMVTFSKRCDNYVPAERRSGQLHKLMEKLYRIETDFNESDYSRLVVDIKMLIKQRSLILIYTNFETMDSLLRQLPYLIDIARYHLLIVVFFDNTEINNMINHASRNELEVYDKIIAEKFAFEKRMIVTELRKHGIQSILTQPECLTIDVINKYLELKSRGMI